MNPDFMTLLKDKRFLLAAGVVAAVGLVVLVRRKGSGEQEGADPDDGSTPAKGAAFNTTGTDVASWVSEYFKSWQEAIQRSQQGGQTTPPGESLPQPAPVPRVPSAPGGTTRNPVPRMSTTPTEYIPPVPVSGTTPRI